MYEISVAADFDAAHFLRGYEGKCERLHGHRFKIVANLRARRTNAIGLVYDFVELRQHLQSVTGRLDHICLNEVAPFDRDNPSSENIARAICSELVKLIPGPEVVVHSVQVWESPGSCVTYFPDD